jgi:hypothetical protein
MVHVQQAGKRGDVPEKTKHAFCNITWKFCPKADH